MYGLHHCFDAMPVQSLDVLDGLCSMRRDRWFTWGWKHIVREVKVPRGKVLKQFATVKPEDETSLRSSGQSGKQSGHVVLPQRPAPRDDVVIFVCGPQGFNESLCRPMLQKLGYKNVATWLLLNLQRKHTPCACSQKSGSFECAKDICFALTVFASQLFETEVMLQWCAAWQCVSLPRPSLMSQDGWVIFRKGFPVNWCKSRFLQVLIITERFLPARPVFV